MAKVIRRRWIGDSGPGVARRDRQSCDYEAYVPDPLTPRTFLLSAETAADVADAERAIATLDAQASALPDTEALARILLRAESVASSRIEGLEVGARRLLRAEAAMKLGEPPSDVTAAEVLANIDAMATAIRGIGPGDPITVEALLEFHRRLLAGTRLDAHAGRIRTEQNWIGGSSYNPCSAAFVPPPPELVRGLLEDLCALLQHRRAARGRAGRDRARAVRDHPPVRRRQRPDRARTHSPGAAQARAGHPGAAAGVARAGDVV